MQNLSLVQVTLEIENGKNALELRPGFQLIQGLGIHESFHSATRF